MTVIVLYGPKGAGKSEVAGLLAAHGRVMHVDPDEVVLDLLDRGETPHPHLGWLVPIEEAVTHALAAHAAVSVEATGAWETDWQLADDLEGLGHEVLRVWVSAPLELTLQRLAQRTTRKAPVGQEEARRIWRASNERVRDHRLDLVLDTGELSHEQLLRALEPLLARLG